MRIIIEFGAEREVILPIHYNSILQGYLYRNLTDKDYRNFLHEKGYQLANRTFKLYTYSRLLGTFRQYQDRGKIGFMPPFKLIVSSALEPFLSDLAETIIKRGNGFLGDNEIEIKSITVQRQPSFGEKVQIKMLSPMVAYSTVYRDGKKTTEYHSPWRRRFTEVVANNLQKKYELIYGERPANQVLSVIPNGNQEHRFERIINYKGTHIKSYAGIYWLKGNPELIQVAYDTGLGSKNAQGFGCWEIVG